MRISRAETARHALEERDRLELVMEEVVSRRPTHQTGAVEADEVLRRALERHVEVSKRVRSMLDGDEAAMLDGEAAPSRTEGALRAFDAEFHEIVSYHAAHPSLGSMAMAAATYEASDEVGEAVDAIARLCGSEGEALRDSMLSGMRVEGRFSGPEVFGQCLDLGDVARQFSGLPWTSKPWDDGAEDGGSLDLGTFCVLVGKEVSEEAFPNRLRSRAYLWYVRNLATYVCDFVRRSKPLAGLRSGLVGVFLEVMKGSLPPKAVVLAREIVGEEGVKGEADGVDNLGEKSVEELMELGGDRLKALLLERRLKCGGTVEQRAKRLFEAMQKEPESKEEEEDSEDSEGGVVPWLEFVPKGGEKEAEYLEKVSEVILGELLNAELNATRERAERLRTLTAAELEAEMDDETKRALGEMKERSRAEDDAADRLVEEEMAKGAKKNLVLDWEGKRIPYWLYRLHEMDKSFHCEICGGETYWGRLAYEQHFGKTRHTNGLSALGIPNTKHFFGITTTDDAQKLWRKLQARGITKPQEGEEEFEDDQGNVLNRKTYEDLARQGLL